MFFWAVKLLGINSIPSDIHSEISFRLCYDPFGPQCCADILWSTLGDTPSIGSFYSGQVEYEPVSPPQDIHGFSTCSFLVFLIKQFPHIHAKICTWLTIHRREPSLGLWSSLEENCATSFSLLCTPSSLGFPTPHIWFSQLINYLGFLLLKRFGNSLCAVSWALIGLICLLLLLPHLSPAHLSPPFHDLLFCIT